MEKLPHFVRERIPDRVYHVKGSGALGYLVMTADGAQWTKPPSSTRSAIAPRFWFASRLWPPTRAPGHGQRCAWLRDQVL